MNMMADGPDIWISLKKVRIIDPLQVIVSHNHGKTFSRHQKGFLRDAWYDGYITKFITDNQKVYALSVRGYVYSHPLSKPISIAQPSTESISIYPNPATNRIQFSEPVEVGSIYNLHGAKVLSFPNGQTQLEVSHLSSGVYLIRTRSGHSAKLVIQK